MSTLRMREVLTKPLSTSSSIGRVVATNALGEAEPSAWAPLTSPRAAPSDFRVVAGGKAA